MNCAAVVLGGSAGSVEVLEQLLGALPADLPVPALMVVHLHASDDGGLSAHLARYSRLPVIEPCDKETLLAGHVYTAPASYHMLVERDGGIALSVDERVLWSRPAIDVLFESAASAWGSGLVALLLSGASHDGTAGLAAVRAGGGYTLVQDTGTAESTFMPAAAIAAGVVDEVLRPARMAGRLVELARGGLT